MTAALSTSMAACMEEKLCIGPSNSRIPLRDKVPPSRILELSPDEVVDIALMALKEAGITFVEQRERLYRRMNVPTCVKDYSFAVKDEFLLPASQIFEGLGLPSFPHVFPCNGYSLNAPRHRIDTKQSPIFTKCIALLPSSFSDLDLEETIDVPSQLKTPLPPQCATIPVPTEQAVYASLMRAMSRYPASSRTMDTLHVELEQLIDYHLLDAQDGYVAPDDLATRESAEALQRRQHAVETVVSWSLLWRHGEEWMGDALVSILREQGAIGHLPSAA